MKKRIGLCVFFVLLLLGSAGGISSIEALQASVTSPEASNVIVPNVTGIPSDVALQILQMAGLNAKIQRGSSRSLTVNSQEPKAGVLAVLGSEVMLAVGGSKIMTSEQVIVFVPEQKTKGQPQTIMIQQVPATNVKTLNVKTSLAWYPKKFLTNTQRSSSGPSILWSSSDGSSSTLRVEPLNTVKVPIIMAPTVGWQYGWVPQGSYSPPQSSSQSIRLQSENLYEYSIQRVHVSSVRVPPVVRLWLSDAEIAFKKAGLSIGNVTQVEDYYLRSGTILQQFPAENSLVPLGTRIDLRVVK